MVQAEMPEREDQYCLNLINLTPCPILLTFSDFCIFLKVYEDMERNYLLLDMSLRIVTFQESSPLFLITCALVIALSHF